ncbi:hypothetical protein [Planctomicrobium piriforme]|uniref:Uncharacterized protein n=1 Tax=Planctomicrobium piriforme TaxID=1576369 RepID=A0A1I3PS92_9PLAN|nr:hypothetical protein [Planctomicrobium piriforme]SFJ24207.1 hypothetical protein SAMN05421753_11713 [Planctomicrobium piriforme]
MEQESPLTPEAAEEILSRLIGIPCWGVKSGYGSFLTLEFGAPQQEIHEVRPPFVRESGSHLRRTVTIRGEWHLWIYCCGWRMTQDRKRLADSESSRKRIERACATLDGQALTKVEYNSAKGSSKFRFDLGGKLKTRPLDNELLEQWSLYLPNGNVLAYHSNGGFTLAPKNNEPAHP